MKLTVGDLFDIPILKNFKLRAGAGGLKNEIKIMEILDFEFTKGVTMPRVTLFSENSFVLTSLLFAKDDPAQLLEAVKGLYSFNASCMAYKTVVYKELPQEVLDFADAHDFPILEFGGDEFFEDIIFAVNQELGVGENIASLERDILKILDQETTPKEEIRIKKKLNPNFKKYIRAVAISDSTIPDEAVILKMIKRWETLDRINKKASICKFKNGYFLLLSQDTKDDERFRALLADIFVMFEIDENKIHYGISSIRLSAEDFGRTLREAFWACNVAVIENTAHRSYEEIGIYRLLVPEIHSKNVQNYMSEYLSPLGDLSDFDAEKPELLNTACIYILSHGDLDETAGKLFCHKNTIRYRLSKLHQLLDPYSNEKEFQENLSIAIRIYLLTQFL